MPLEQEKDGVTTDDEEREQRALYDSLPDPDTDEFPYPELDELERTSADEFYRS